MPRLGPIVRDKPYQRPGARRQLVTAIAVVAGIAVILVAAYFFFLPRKQDYVLETWTEAVVRRGNLEETFDGVGILAMEKTEDLLSPQSGVLQDVLVAPGDTVSVGLPVARIKSEYLEQALEEAQSLREGTKRDRTELLSLRDLEAEAYQRRHTSLQQGVDVAEDNLKAHRALFSIGSATQVDVKRAEADLQVAKDALLDAETSQKISEARSRFQEQDEQAGMDRYNARVAALQAQIEACTIRSPLAGQVTRVYYDRGRFVPQYTAVVTVVNLSKPEVELTVPASAIGKLTPMQQASVLVGDRSYDAHVDEIGLEATSAQASQAPTVQVIIRFDKLPPKVFPGASASVSISLGTKQGVLWLPRAPFLTSGSQLTVFRVEGETAVRMEAFFGIVTDQAVEVVSGLAEGDVAITSSYQDFLQHPEVILTKGGGRR